VRVGQLVEVGVLLPAPAKGCCRRGYPAEDDRDCPAADALWLSQDTCLVKKGRFGEEPQKDGTNLRGGKVVFKTEKQAKKSGGLETGFAKAGQTKSCLVHGLCLGYGLKQS
jgi:hypothetical protein